MSKLWSEEMPDEPVVDDSLNQEDMELLGLTPEDSPTAKEPEATPVVEAEAAEAKDEPKEKPAKDLPDWSKPLTKVQQENASLRKEVSELKTELKTSLTRNESALNKLLAHVGIDNEATPAEVEKEVQALDPDTRAEVMLLRQKVEFQEIKSDHPGADPHKAWEKCWDEAFEAFDVDEKSATLPEGVTQKALQRFVDKKFQAYRDGLAKKPTPAAPPSPPRRLPPKTAGGAGVPTRPASHVPSPVPTADAREDFRRDLQVLMGPGD